MNIDFRSFQFPSALLSSLQLCCYYQLLPLLPLMETDTS
jgi:hypothetical protein